MRCVVAVVLLCCCAAMMTWLHSKLVYTSWLLPCVPPRPLRTHLQQLASRLLPRCWIKCLTCCTQLLRSVAVTSAIHCCSFQRRQVWSASGRLAV